MLLPLMWLCSCHKLKTPTGRNSGHCEWRGLLIVTDRHLVVNYSNNSPETKVRRVTKEVVTEKENCALGKVLCHVWLYNVEMISKSFYQFEQYYIYFYAIKRKVENNSKYLNMVGYLFFKLTTELRILTFQIVFRAWQGPRSSKKIKIINNGKTKIPTYF